MGNQFNALSDLFIYKQLHSPDVSKLTVIHLVASWFTIENINLLNVEVECGDKELICKDLTNQELAIYRYGVTLLKILFSPEELLMGSIQLGTSRYGPKPKRKPLDLERVNLLKGILI